MTSFRLSPKEFAALANAINNPAEPTDKLRLLMRGAVSLWNEEVERGITDDERELLRRLP